MIDPIVNKPEPISEVSAQEELRRSKKEQLLKAIEEQKRRNQALQQALGVGEQNNSFSDDSAAVSPEIQSKTIEIKEIQNQIAKLRDQQVYHKAAYAQLEDKARAALK